MFRVTAIASIYSGRSPQRPSYFSHTQFSLESPNNPKEAITLDLELVSYGQTLAAPSSLLRQLLIWA
jgi:hypothetical protein